MFNDHYATEIFIFLQRGNVSSVKNTAPLATTKNLKWVNVEIVGSNYISIEQTNIK